MQDRYLGNDRNVQRLVDASTQATAVQAQVSQANQRASSNVVDTIIQGQAQLQQIEIQRMQANARRASQTTGLQGLVATAGEVFNVERKRQAETESAAAKAAQEAAVKQAQLQEEQEFLNADNEVSQLQREYLKNNWNAGTSNFKAQAERAIAKYPTVLNNPKRASELLKRVNSIAVARDEETRVSTETAIEKTQNELADIAAQKLLLGVTPTIAQLKNLLPTEQSTEFIQKYIEPRYQQWLADYPTLTLDQKLRAESQLITQVQLALNGKSEAYATYEAKMKARSVWISEYGMLNQKLQTGQIDLGAFKDGVLALELRTGVDLSKYQAQIGEQETKQLELLNISERLASIQETARQRGIANYEGFTPTATRALAAGILSSPGLIIQLKNNPRLKDSPLVKQAEEISSRVAKARQALADQSIADAQTSVKFQQLNLSRTSDFISVTRSLATRMTSGEQLSPQEQLAKLTLEKLMATDPELAAQINSIGTTSKALTPQQLAELQNTLNINSQAIVQVRTAVVNENEARRNKVYEDYRDVIQLFGTIPGDEHLRKLYESDRGTIDTEVQTFEQSVQQQVQQSTLVPGYGQQPNFKHAGGIFAVNYQQDSNTGIESYTVAPKTALQVQTNAGEAFITPIQKGVNKFHSFNQGSKGGALGGGYGAWRNRSGGWSKSHAGIDFPLSSGEKAMSVVSGRVLSVGNVSGYGGTIDVLGDNGFVYRYAHQSAYVKPGQRVNAGQAISTSNGSGVGSHHLHFEVRPYTEYQKNKYGMAGTIDPITHLRDITKKAGTTTGSTQTGLRGQPTSTISSQVPWLKANNSSIFTTSGGVLNGGLFQQVGGATRPANQVFNTQRPMTNTGGLQSFRAGTPTYDYNSNYGFAYLDKNPDLKKAFVDAAKELKIPAEWIVDIAAQESGAFSMATKIHNSRSKTQNYGLFGFGNNSGVKNYTSLNPVQQVQAYVKYMKDNGWFKHVERVGGNVDIAQAWAMTRMGWDWRQDILAGRKDTSLRLDDSGKTYAEEIRLLGNHVGREYDVPGGSRSGRSKRNSAVKSNIHSNLQQNLANVDAGIPARDA